MQVMVRLRAPLAVVAALVAMALSSGCTTPPQTPVPHCEQPGSDCVGALLEALEEWKSAYNSRDPRRLQQLYSPGALITDDEYSAVPLSGAALPEFFDQMAQRPTARMRWIIGNLQLFGDTAVRSGEYEFSEEVDGQTRERPARYSFAYQRIGGRWLIVLQHSTLRP
ncbi:MAG: nuclear transport factor 2 family protein [Comamonadaceae bacterium]|jgi:hypothetical protein|nr:nuclear transport factor 2 family protein [Comamonadaceae bacterium]